MPPPTLLCNIFAADSLPEDAASFAGLEVFRVCWSATWVFRPRATGRPRPRNATHCLRPASMTGTSMRTRQAAPVRIARALRAHSNAPGKAIA